MNLICIIIDYEGFICIFIHKDMCMIRAGIIGASGYTGQELIRILSRHPETELVKATSRSLAGTSVAQEYGNLGRVTDLVFSNPPLEEAAQDCDVLFLCLPHGEASSKVSSRVLERTVIIDLGADYRLKDRGVYEAWYKTVHETPELLEKSVYGLPELHKDSIAAAQLIANPGCYTTCAILSLAPLMKYGLIDPASVIIDAKSGVSGAGRTAKTAMMFCECNESIKPYGVTTHRHTPEIEQELSLLAGTGVTVSFTPHLIPMNRGILTTSYAAPVSGETPESIRGIYEEFFSDAPFVRILSEGVWPETRWTAGSNFCDISAAVDQRTGRVIVMAAIDNLVKGASGQAVQNMNIRFGLDQSAGLLQAGLIPR